jgi:hypothetical protein
MIVDPSDVNSLKSFFNEYGWMTASAQAVLVGRSISTVRRWRRKCELAPKGKTPHAGRQPAPLPVGQVLPREVWDNKEWLAENYKLYGTTHMGKMAGVSGRLIYNRLIKYGIKPRKVGENVTRHDCCNESWLYYHYSTRDEYVKWCRTNKTAPDKHGGMALNLRECADLAGVVSGTIVNWLTKFNIRIRGRSEAWSGERNPMYGKRHKASTKRKIRDKYFEAYRQGLIQFPIGPVRYSNGQRVAPEVNSPPYDNGGTTTP